MSKQACEAGQGFLDGNRGGLTLAGIWGSVDHERRKDENLQPEQRRIQFQVLRLVPNVAC